jgi:chemotaxis signal transduction protein
MTAHATAIPDPMAAAAPVTDGWVVLAIDGLRLALPQEDVRQIELVTDLKRSAGSEAREIGWLVRAHGDPWPVYCLDDALRLQHAVRDTRRVCIFIEAGGEVLGIVCDHVWSLATRAELIVETLPGCMRDTRSPISRAARFREEIALVTDAGDLADYLGFLREQA